MSMIITKKLIIIYGVGVLSILRICQARTSDTQHVCNDQQSWDGVQCVNCLSGCNCGTTKLESTCDQCLTGYIEYNPTQIVFPAGQAQCLNCSPECGDKCCLNYTSHVQVCQNCPPQHYLSSWFCQPCLDPNCLSCANSGICTKCKDGFFMNSIAICQPCAGNNCATCLKGPCTTCPDGYYPDSFTGDCLLCSGSGSFQQGCLSCNPLQPTRCKICSPYNYVDGQGKCRLVAFCDVIEIIGEKCTSCADGYYLNLLGKCIACPQFGAARCSSSSNLIQCQNDKAITQDKSSCVYRIKHCVQYQNTGNCSQCDATYTWLSSGSCMETCVSAIPNCLSCINGTVSTAVTCSQCAAGYFIGPGSTSCILCGDDNNGGIRGCLSCTPAPLTCTACKQGFFLDAVANTCTGCTPDLRGSGCLTCSSSVVCSTCVTNAFSVAGTCNLCDVSCGTCTDLGYQNCSTSCSSSAYYLDNTTNCLKCQTNMIGCLACSSKTTCLKCSDSYFLSTDPQFAGTPKQCQRFNGCKVSDPGKACLLCSAGYSLVNNGCVECTTSDCQKTCVDKPNIEMAVFSQLLKTSFVFLALSYIILLL